ncbi:MAG: hypothetical protein H8E21_18110 [Gammaproteobacteria bacterium]|nr:hypothetical protein [Gammaproteobacteria bacterium]MBL7000970.1 hypothetical protein [Gammaproteobacteria bacterium]
MNYKFMDKPAIGNRLTKALAEATINPLGSVILVVELSKGDIIRFESYPENEQSYMI